MKKIIDDYNPSAICLQETKLNEAIDFKGMNSATLSTPVEIELAVEPPSLSKNPSPIAPSLSAPHFRHVPFL